MRLKLRRFPINAYSGTTVGHWWRRLEHVLRLLMLWYGFGVRKNLTQALRNTKFNHNLRVKNLALSLNLRVNMNYQGLTFYVPSNWPVLLLQPKNNRSPYNVIYAFSNVYYFKFPLPTQHLGMIISPQVQSVYFYRYISNAYFLTFMNLFYKLLFSFFRIFFNKLKIVGKGYYIYKNFRNTVTPTFGHAHRLYFYSYFLSVKFLSKTTIFIFGLSVRDVYLKSYEIQHSKPMNVFTGRGVRFTRQIVYRKVGKVSSYR